MSSASSHALAAELELVYRLQGPEAMLRALMEHDHLLSELVGPRFFAQVHFRREGSVGQPVRLLSSTTGHGSMPDDKIVRRFRKAIGRLFRPAMLQAALQEKDSPIYVTRLLRARTRVARNRGESSLPATIIFFTVQCDPEAKKAL